MGLIALVLYWLLQVYFFALIARFVVDLVISINRDWQPKGLGLIIVELVCTVTDPPLKLARKLLPPLRIGPIALDFGWTLVIGAVLLAERLVMLLA